MCGIAGILAPGPDGALAVRRAMTAMAHRGPDGSGLHDAGPCVLGHVRLAILDLSDRAAQPMPGPGARHWIAFNGEIYNYIELRRELEAAGERFRSSSDTEVLLAAYVRWGRGCLPRLRGMFAFAVWDSRDRTLFLARDRTGEKPLCYASSGGSFLFASELKGLLAMLPGAPDLDPAAVDAYLHYQYVPEPATPLRGVLKLPAGHCMTLAPGRPPEPEPYWRPEDEPPVHGDPAALVRAELEHAVELTLRSDVPVGLALSGGVDSGSLAALAAARAPGTLHAFSVGYPGRPHHDERDRARALAARLGLKYHSAELDTRDMRAFFPRLVRIMDDPIADIAAFGHYSVMRLAADHGVKVLFTGLGGDELFWGYPWVGRAARLTRRKGRWLRGPAWLRGLWPALRAATGGTLLLRAGRSARVPALPRALAGWLRDVSLLTLDRPGHAVFYDLAPDFIAARAALPGLYSPDFARAVPPANAFEPFRMAGDDWDNPARAVFSALLHTWLTSNCLALGDRVSMACSVEARTPLLDHGLLRLALGLLQARPAAPPEGKPWLKAAMRGLLPDEVARQPKLGFQPPPQAWIQAVLDDRLDRLRAGQLVERGVLAPAGLEALAARWRASGRDGFLLFKLVLLETWLDTVARAGQGAAE